MSRVQLLSNIHIIFYCRSSYLCKPDGLFNAVPKGFSQRQHSLTQIQHTHGHTLRVFMQQRGLPAARKQIIISDNNLFCSFSSVVDECRSQHLPERCLVCSRVLPSVQQRSTLAQMIHSSHSASSPHQAASCWEQSLRASNLKWLLSGMFSS